MKGCSYWSWLMIAIAASAIFSCARTAAPSGGPDDTSPPRIVKSVPLKSSRNFKGKKIVITFDEYVVLDKMTDKFMVSPPLNKKPEIFPKGKSLNIEFKEDLKDSTTYTLYFQDAIKDLNAGNPLVNFQFVFSTGSVLDSLSVTGNVYNASDLEVTENTLILMHRNLADSAPVKLIPNYIGLADVNGGFRINNVREGTYRLYALQDKNNNKKFDLADEGFAFMENPIMVNTAKNFLPVVEVKDTVKTIPAKDKLSLKKAPQIPFFDGEHKLFLFTHPRNNHYLTSSGRKTLNHLTYTLSLPPDTVDFYFAIPGSDESSYFIEKNTAGDTIDIWLTDSLVYKKPEITTLTGYPFTDSTGVTRLKTDTIVMRFIQTRSTRARESVSRFTYSANFGGNTKPGQQLLFYSATPFRAPDTTRIRLTESGKTGKSTVPFALLRDTLNSRRYILKAKLKEGGEYFFLADSGAFGNIYGNVADSVGIRVSVRNPDTYGKLSMNLKKVSGKLIIQLLDTREKVLYEKISTKDGMVDFPLLERGSYRVRAVFDLNEDGKWTTGNFLSRTRPEPVSYFPGDIEIRVDFQIVQDWDVDRQNEKDLKMRAMKDQNR